MRSRLLRSLVVALLVSVLLPAAAAADGDPASDVLLGENVFYPYSPPTSPAVQKQLNAETAAAKQAHFPLKVALIGAPVDLGVIPSLFGKPQKYADFLDQEISFQTKQPLLVVMAGGYGVQGVDAKTKAVAAALAKPSGTQGNELARAAIAAVPKLAAAAGHPLKGSQSGGSGGGGDSSRAILVAALAAVAIAAAAGLVVVRRRFAVHE
ncbi:MAG: hypothetical protein ACXVFA_12345 [Solirubrobacteraceae bacterium]